MRTDPKRVKEIFLEAAERPDDAGRVAYLDGACENDAALRDRVEALLRSHDPGDDFLANPAVELPGHDRVITTVFDTSYPSDDSSITQHDEQLELREFLTPATRPDSLGRIGHYEVLEVLGRGGFGIVFRAFDEKLHRIVAVKVLAPALAVTSPARKRFLREARSSAKVRHENVVQIYAVEEYPLPHLVMEFIPGETLQQRLNRTGPLELPDCLHIGQQIAEGLAAAHATGLIHRDIKPANILVESGPNQAVKITDFGLARAADDASATQSGVVAGTPMYMAPEQAQGDQLDHRADLFSLGSVLYAMCSGRPPFRGKSTLAVLKRVAEDTPRPIPEIIPEVPQWLCDIITRLHAKNPDDRIATAREVADLLARGLAAIQGVRNLPFISEQSQVAVTDELCTFETLAQTVYVPKPEPAIRQRFRTRRWATATVLLVLLGGLGFTEAVGVTDFRGTVIRLFTPEGTLVVEVDDPGVSVKIDGSEVVITGAGVKEIRLQPGRYTVEASKNGKLLQQELVNVTRNGRQVVRVSQELPAVAGAPENKVATRPADASAWERVVTALSPAVQVKAVSARLKELNPGFDGVVVPTIENGAVRELALKTNDVADISPVSVLTKLQSFKLCGTEDLKSPLVDLSPLSGLPLASLEIGKGQLSDLSPLKGVPLTSLVIYGTHISDLSPLKGMKLRHLKCIGNGNVTDISPLKGMLLETLDITGNVCDISPLRGMPLKSLSIYGTKTDDLTTIAGLKKLTQLDISVAPISDLSSLKGLELTTLSLAGTQVSDLSPLKGMKLTWLTCSGTKVSDVSPLNGMPLRELNLAGTQVSDANLAQLKDCKDLIKLVLFNTQISDAGLTHLKNHKNLKMLLLYGSKVSDLSSLKDMALEEIVLTPNDISDRGLDILRNMKSLKTIGTPWGLLPATEFWARYEKGEFKK